MGKIIVAHPKPTIIGSHLATFKIFPSLFEEPGNILFPEVQCSLGISFPPSDPVTIYGIAEF